MMIGFIPVSGIAAAGAPAAGNIHQGRKVKAPKAITSYAFANPPATGTINEKTKTISVTVPAGTNVTALVAKFETTGKTVKVGPAVQVSGVTPNRFNRTVAYRVIAADRDVAVYKVRVTVESGVVIAPPPPSSSPAARFAYGVNAGNNTVSQYTVNADGSLSPMVPAAVSTGSGPTSIAVDPSSKYAYVANEAGYISQYTIGTDGRLAPMSTPTVAAVSPNPGQGNVSITVEASGRYAYMTNFADLSVSQYTINSDGSLSSMTTPTVAAGKYPVAIATDPLGKYAYVANNFGTVSQYAINTDGALVPMTTPSVEAGYGSWGVTVHPSGRYAYVPNEAAGNISQYTIGGDGGLVAMSVPAVPAGAGPASVAVHPSGKYAYAANFGYNISQYTVGTDGALTAMSPSIVSAGANPVSMVVDKSGGYAYAANFGDGTVSQFTIDSSGDLTPMSTASVPAGPAPSSIVLVY